MNSKWCGEYLSGSAALSMRAGGKILDFHPHTALLFQQIGRIMSGEIDRLLICMPPRHGKSSSVAISVGAWLVHQPWVKFGLATYGAELSGDLARMVRQTYTSLGGNYGSISTVLNWNTPSGGGMWSTGVGGSQIGRGADVLIGDDIIKGRKDADSEAERKNVWDWYTSTFRNRLNTKGLDRMICIGTRWHKDDILGRLIEHERGSEHPEGWTILLIDMEYDEDTIIDLQDKLPHHEVIGLWDREPGEMLHMLPKWKALRMKSTTGSREWACVFQQNPVPEGGLLLDVSKFKYYDALPANPAYTVRSWDLAGSESPTADRTVGLRMSMYGEGLDRIWVIDDIQFGRWAPTERMERIGGTAAKDGQDIRVLIERDSGIDGKGRTNSLISAVAPSIAETINPSKNKRKRAESFAANVGAGNVYIVRGRKWLNPFLDELRDFPVGRHDDFVDAASQAFNWLSEKGGGASWADALEVMG